MHILKKPPRQMGLNEPLRHADHALPVTRREAIARGFLAGGISLAAPTFLSLFANPRAAYAALAADIEQRKALCGIAPGAGKIPFIAIDLAGGANMVGSEVLIGGPGGQLDFLSTAGYAKLGLPGDRVPNAPNAASATNNFVDTRLGIAWHSDGAFLRGMLTRLSAAAMQNVNGAVIAARSENDTQNNVHNPMYGIRRAGADGELLTLIGSRNSDSGGNSMSPASMIDLTARPTKVDRTSDVTGLVDTGKLGTLFADPNDAVAVLESMVRLSDRKLAQVNTKLPATAKLDDAALKQLVACGYVSAADLADRFSSPATLNPAIDPQIVGPGGVFTQAEFTADAEFEKTAAVMKLVLNGFAGAGTITMGGYDYHGLGRATGESRNFRAGACMGAILEYAHRRQVPCMLYVFSDGSVSANGQIDSSAGGRGKFMWASDNQSTAASFILVYNPRGRPQLAAGLGGVSAARHQQIGYFRPDGSVETASSPAANAVNLLVETVVLNYMALHGEAGNFASLFPNHGLGGTQLRDSLVAFAPIVNGTITSPG